MGWRTAIFCGIDPADGKFFVATKSVFNKNPKLNKTNADIRKNHTGGLVEKLTVALSELSKLGIKGVVQGDMMYTSSDLKKTTHEGEKYITFQPNTIVYAVPEDGLSASLLRKLKWVLSFIRHILARH